MPEQLVREWCVQRMYVRQAVPSGAKMREWRLPNADFHVW